MRILLTSNASFLPPRGGSTRSNRVWLEYLAWRGHACQVLCGAAPAETAEQIQRVRNEAGHQGWVVDPAREFSHAVVASGIAVTSYRDLARHKGVVAKTIREFEPDWVLVSSEDIGHSLLREADEAAPGRVVYLAHTPQFLPFGPESWSPDRHAAQRVKNAAAIVTIGRHMAQYVNRYLGAPAETIHPAIYGPGPWDTFANFDRGHVLMVNPCTVKGIGIFAEVARAMPDTSFAALPGWGTTSPDRALLSSIPNVRLLEPARRIEEILERTRLLLMPSLWYEGFGLIAMEAMLRGIPVVASDSGGLTEAKRGSGFVLHCNPIVEYLAEFDEVHMPRPVIPPQDISAWINAVKSLVTERAAYENESERSREAALDFVQRLRPSAIEELLVRLRPAPPASPFHRLGAAQKALLLARLRAKVR